uniref:Uncharacterized protein n=1 Tax=Caenorhabditis tropicalis TaxID=1561998 RepID=A0A1I7TMK1_9PELO
MTYSIHRIPEVEVDWSSKVRCLRRIRFGYCKKNIVNGCINEAINANLNPEIAAIICSLKIPKTCSQMGSLLASLASFCQGNDGRAVVVIDFREEEEVRIEDKNIGYRLQIVTIQEEKDEESNEVDPFENMEFLEEEEKKTDSITIEKTRKDEEKFLQKLKNVSAIYTKNVLMFDGEQFSDCF